MAHAHQFERVVIGSLEGLQDEHGFSFRQPPDKLLGKAGTVIWVDHEDHRSVGPVYLVELDLGDGPLWVLVGAGVLTFTGQYEDPARWQASRSEVSFDTVPGGREGCLRRPGTFWECFFFQQRPVAETTCRTSTWRSGITGHLFIAPEDADIDSEAFVLDAFESLLSMHPIHRVRGPDSLILK